MHVEYNYAITVKLSVNKNSLIHRSISERYTRLMNYSLRGQVRWDDRQDDDCERQVLTREQRWWLLSQRPMWQTRQHAATAWPALNIADFNGWPWFRFLFERPTFPHTDEHHSQQAGRQDTGGGQQSNSRRQVEVVASLSELQVANNGTKPGSRYLHQTQTIHAHCTQLQLIITSNIRKRFIIDAQNFFMTNKYVKAGK